MSSFSFVSKQFVAYGRFTLFLCLAASTVAGQSKDAVSDDEIISVVMLARHGVRAPLESEIRGGLYNSQPWPVWTVGEGVLTEHGTKALTLLGDYYRSRYPSLLQHVSCEDPGIFAEANTTQRTIASAKAMLAGMAPECTIDVHTTPPDQRNPLFSPVSSDTSDRPRIAVATVGRMSGHPDWFTNAFAAPLAKMHQVLTDCSGSKDCDRNKPDFRAAVAKNETTSLQASTETPVTLGADFAENLLLEYTEGLPMSQVGWGRVTRGEIDQLMEMNTRYHDFIARTPESAQMTASNLAAHIRDTVISAALDQAKPRKLGKPHDRFVLLAAHDGNIAALGGLLDMEWLLPDQTFDATPPGGAVVFEVHKNRSTGVKTVQAMFISQTLDQMRYLRPLHGVEKPSIAPIFLHGCSGQAPTYACSIEEFDKAMTASIIPRFVVQTDPAH